MCCSEITFLRYCDLDVNSLLDKSSNCFWVTSFRIILVLIDGYFVIGFSYLLFLVNWSNFFATSLVKILLETDDMVLLLLSAVEDINISDNNKMALVGFFKNLKKLKQHHFEGEVFNSQLVYQPTQEAA